MGLILDALINSQSRTVHADPLQFTAHFLKFVEQGPFEVHAKVVRQGNAFTNLAATLVQKVCFCIPRIIYLLERLAQF